MLNSCANGLLKTEAPSFKHQDGNKRIGDDTKAAAPQSPNCIKKQKNMAKNHFQYGGWNSYTL